MAVRDDLHALVDELPESELRTAQRYLQRLKREVDDPLTRFLNEAPRDDEPTTPEEDLGATEAREQVRRGETISADEIKRSLLA